MRALILLPALALLTACATQQTRVETYTCPNGPDLVVSYTDEGARIVFPTGRVETLAPTDRENLYATTGVVFDATAFRNARLTDGQQSYSCDQLGG